MTVHDLTWDDVLAQVEADVRSTESLLTATSAATDQVVTRELAPAELMLPSTVVTGFGPTGPDLPPLSAMPPVPPELLDRIAELRARIAALRVEIKAEMVQLQMMNARIDTKQRSSAKNEATPRFVDRAL
jgi:hypothetical protein